MMLQAGKHERVKLGFLGGTFNPIHNGHIAAALNAIECLGLSKVIMLPNSTPPHKGDDELLPFAVRYRLIEESIREYPQLEVSDLDNTHSDKSYTYHLLQRLKESYPAADFFFIIGTDNIRKLKTWYRYEELLREITFAVVTRNTNDDNLEDKPDYYDRMVFLPMQPVDISSTDIRNLIRKGKDITGFVPGAVAKYFDKS